MEIGGFLSSYSQGLSVPQWAGEEVAARDLLAKSGGRPVQCEAEGVLAELCGDRGCRRAGVQNEGLAELEKGSRRELLLGEEGRGRLQTPA